MTKVPPLLNPPPRSWAPAALFGVVLAIVLSAHLSAAINFQLPKCALKATTGIPCPTCGGTRALRALALCDFSGALKWNPIVTVAALTSLAIFILWIALPSEKFGKIQKRLLSKPFALFAVFALIANWIYVILTLPG